MATTTAGLMMMMAGWTAGTATPSYAAPAVASVVVLHVTNSAHVSVGDLAKAERVATRVYADVGGRTVWTDGSAWDAPPDGAFHADVLLLSKDMVTRKSQLDGLDGQVFGSA